ncbi:hypothetical protein PILCRDRAFT_2457 [Piloderma croceum F 1598]|uniref:Uncharacterized protein n=1 Tax=Piloderma croceum (strain F 1598) TaxID=765440 RepID=A0A0C3GBT8_PILCF|nr:hypothetical protein PILCRDRAFT_2457 [Piloderma croceum F 1598]
MDGKIWERPDAVYAVLGYAPRLPHLRGALVAFFEGALDTWERFTDEYRPEGAIASASISERRRAYMKTTNDDNEGALGEARRASQHAPNMTLNQHNARTMYRKNNTVAFIQTCLGPEDLKYLRRRARELDASGVAKDQREQQATAYKETVDKKRKAASARKAIVDAKRTRIDAVVPRLDTQSITDNPGTNNELDLQLEWHQRLDSDKHIPPKTKMTRKEDKVTALVAAVKQYNEGTVHAPEATEDVEMLAEVPDDLDEEESDWEH